MRVSLNQRVMHSQITVLTGVGKSFLVAQLGASLLQSVGVRAVAVHATDLLHGSLGLLSNGGVLIAISHSGRTAEVIAALQGSRELAGHRVLITGNHQVNSSVGADEYLIYAQARDGSTHGTIPTESVASQLGYLSEIVVDIANTLTPAELLDYHPHGGLAAAYRKETT